MQVIKSPQIIPQSHESRTLFLAGSIEMGGAEMWQKKAEELLSDTNWVIFNPRRDQWDSTWIQEIGNPLFKEQVEWELTALEKADKVLLYLDPATKSPISLLELGLFARVPDKLIVVCPKGFWRKGNVDIVCQVYSVKQMDTLEQAVEELRKM